MRNYKRILSLLLSIAAVLTVSACKESENTSSNTGTPKKNSVTSFETRVDEDNKEITYVGDDSRISDDLTVKLYGQMTGESDDAAKALRKEIINSGDTIKASGNTWYISSGGDDKNKGDSPEQAWKTTAGYTANVHNIKAGDAVLFERGGIYRGTLKAISGVSYGAYGEGPKPCLYGAKLNAAKEDWRRTSEENIYALITTAADIGTIVFNHGEQYGVRKLNKVFECKQDYDFFHDTENGLLYVYCSKGKPSDVFYDIELLEKISIFNIPNNSEKIYVENLCLKYCGVFGFNIGRPVKNITIKNCEIGWIGGSMQDASTQTRYGNAIQFYGDCADSIIDHCWIYQVYDAGITHQWNASSKIPKAVAENISYTNNLIEYCTYSIEYFWHPVEGITTRDESRQNNITIANNIMRFAGYGFGKQRPTNGNAGHIASWASENPATNFVVENNIFDTSFTNLFSCFETVSSELPVFKGNKYYQKKGAMIGIYGTAKDKYGTDSSGEAFLKLLDKEGTVILL